MRRKPFPGIPEFCTAEQKPFGIWTPGVTMRPANGPMNRQWENRRSMKKRSDAKTEST
jgi:hypothetical protein